MNLVGEHGQGESVWLAFFLFDVLDEFAELARARGDAAFARPLRARGRASCGATRGACAGTASGIAAPTSTTARPWARRPTPNARSIRSRRAGPCSPARATPSGRGTAMDAVDQRLVRRDAGLIQLFDPPFDKSPLDPGYIKGYVPGVRENGGQYTHAAVWAVMAFAALGDYRRARGNCSHMINPVITRTPRSDRDLQGRTLCRGRRRLCGAPHTGRGGWTWYTGSRAGCTA